MSRLSDDKIKKIKEQMLVELYHRGLKPIFTNELASLIIRDEEFVKRLLGNLKDDGLVVEVAKSSKGNTYSKWKRWKLSDNAYKAMQQVY